MISNTESDEYITFAESAGESVEAAHDLPRWKILVVDDEPLVHTLTQMALRDFQFEGRKVHIHSAYSGAEARELIALHQDAALMLLDVVMEEDHSGLQVVQYVREVLRNKKLRIVLRTGQPGVAPERDVIARYDINDYKEKTELTADKLFTLMHACLRAYRDLCIIEENKRSLEQIIISSADLFQSTSLERLTSGVLGQLDALLNIRGGFFARSRQGELSSGAMALERSDEQSIRVVAATGNFAGSEGKSALDLLPPQALEKLHLASETGQSQYWDQQFLGVYRASSRSDRIVYLTGVQPLSEFDLHLVELFSHNAGISFENLRLREEVEETQRELVYRLGGAVETRSKETGGHVRRVAEMSRHLALLAGMPDYDATILKHASPMHDVGKIGIPDAILNKPGALNPDEWQIMKRHTTIGHELFEGTERDILRLGGLISLEHHEKWDGSGYPMGKKGTEISLAGRITAIVDVLDALLSKRVYKEAWPMDTVIASIREQSGRHFDPTLIDLLLTRLPEFLEIRARHRDAHEASG